MGKPGPQQAEAIRCLRLWGPETQKVPQSRELQKLFSILGSLGAKSQGPELSLTRLLLLRAATPSFGTHRRDSAGDPLELYVPQFKVIQAEHSSGGRVLAYRLKLSI